MKHKSFWNLDQANNYLNGCVVVVGKEPVYVTEVASGIDRGNRPTIVMRYIECANPSSSRSRAIDVMDDAVDLNPVQLGMCEFFNGIEYETYFLTRRPSRMWKVGLTRSNLIIHRPDLSMRQHTNDMSRHLLPSKELADTILNKYRSFEEVKTQLKKHRGVLPFSQRFCLNAKGELFYRVIGEPVGDVDKTGIKLRKDYKYLDEALKEDLK